MLALAALRWRVNSQADINQIKLQTVTLDYMLHRFLSALCVCEGNLNPAREWWTLPLKIKTTILLQ